MLASLTEEEKYLTRRLADEARFRQREEDAVKVKEEKKEHYRKWLEKEKQRNMEREAGHPKELRRIRGEVVSDDEDDDHYDDNDEEHQKAAAVVVVADVMVDRKEVGPSFATKFSDLERPPCVGGENIETTMVEIATSQRRTTKREEEEVTSVTPVVTAPAIDAGKGDNREEGDEEGEWQKLAARGATDADDFLWEELLRSEDGGAIDTVENDMVLGEKASIENVVPSTVVDREVVEIENLVGKTQLRNEDEAKSSSFPIFTQSMNPLVDSGGNRSCIKNGPCDLSRELSRELSRDGSCDRFENEEAREDTREEAGFQITKDDDHSSPIDKNHERRQSSKSKKDDFNVDDLDFFDQMLNEEKQYLNDNQLTPIGLVFDNVL